MNDGSGVTAWTYDSRGRKLMEMKTIDSQSFSISWSYNKADLPVSMTYPDGEVLQLDYNDQGLLEGMSNDSDFTYIHSLVYDEAGRVTGMGLGEENGSAIIQRAYSYNNWSDNIAGGLLAGLTSSNNQNIDLQNLSYDYDRNGNITEIVDGVATETSAFSYDGLDRLTNMAVSQNGSTTSEEIFTYDEAGRMAGKNGDLFSYDGSHPHAVSGLDGNTYLYDENGNQISRSLSEGDYSLTYDAENRLMQVNTNLQMRMAPTLDGSLTPTGTLTTTPDGSLTPTEMIIETATETLAETATETATGAPTETITETATETVTETLTETATHEATLSGARISNKVLAAPKWQEEATATPTPTETATETATETIPPTDTETPTDTSVVVNTATETATETATATETVTPAGSETSTETPTLTGSETATETETPTITTTPTATGIPTEPAPEPLQNAYYTYDGDGNLVKSVVNDKTTYYLGKLYQKKLDGESVTVQKYYATGAAQFAVRTIQAESNTLQWILSDHLGSTSTTANADGSWNSTIQYSAFGEIRASSGITSTEFRYTGQLRQAELGLYFYVSRWYDPALAHFTQADTIVPNAGDAAAFDKYAYVKNNPVNYIDPTGHMYDDGCRTLGCTTPAGGSNSTVTTPPSENPYMNGARRNTSNSGNSQSRGHNSFSSRDGDISSDIVNGYLNGWQNFNSATYAFANSNDFIYGKVMSGAYIIAWGGAHVFLVAGIGGLICAASSASCVIAVEAGLGISNAIGADGDPINEIRLASLSTTNVVNSITQSTHQRIGGLLERAAGNGWKITLPNSYNGNDVVIRIMESSRARIDPYFRIAVDRIGALTKAGSFSDIPELTHIPINMSSPGQTVDEIINLVQGVLK